MFKGLRTAICPTPDITAGRAWYAKVLGVAPYYDQPYYVGFEVGGFELGLIPDRKPGVDGSEVYWGVANADAEVERLLSLGATPLEAVHEVGEGVRVGSVLDPFGNRLSVIENPGFDLGKVR